MANIIFISAICVLLIGLSLILIFYKKIRIVKENDDLLTILTNAAVILTLAYGIFSYTHTVHPVFEKETELNELRVQLTDSEKMYASMETRLASENAVLQTSNDELTNAVNDKTEKYNDLSEKYEALSLEKIELTGRNNELGFKLHTAERIAVYNIGLKEIHSAADKNIYFNKNIKENLLEVIADNGNNGYEEDSIEFRAYRILSMFIDSELSDESTYSDAFQFILYFYNNYDLLYPFS